LWGFLIQQTLVHFYPMLDGLANCLISMCLAILMGTLSWILIEKPGMELGKKLFILSKNKIIT
jgi:peptidoglycan/LPS O-acetylase OafA/YrhL